ALGLVSKSARGAQPEAVDRLLVWFSNWRTVIWAVACGSATRNQGRYRCTGASRSTFPASTSCITARAVNDFVTEPTKKGVWGEGGVQHGRLWPKPRWCMICSLSTVAAA